MVRPTQWEAPIFPADWRTGTHLRRRKWREVTQERNRVTQERDRVTQKYDRVTQERDRVTQERDRLLAKLRELGVDPEKL